MKLHRVLATAVVTAVISPLTLLAAPAASATDQVPTPSATPSASAPATSSSTGADGTHGGDSAAGDMRSGEAAAKRPAAEPTPTASGAAKPSTTPSPTETGSTSCFPIFDADRGKTGLAGLPSKIVANSGWHEFTYRVTNVSRIAVRATDISLSLGTADPKLSDIAELDVTVQWFNPKTHAWKPIEGEGAKFQDSDDFATIKRLEPGEYADAKLRIKAGGKAKAGTGYFFTIGYSYGEDDRCGFDNISQFDFTVLSPHSKPGPVDDAQGKPVDGKGRSEKPGTAGNQTASHGGHDELPVSGTLAETGSSDRLPTLAAIGGAAVLAGAGAVVIARRRRTGSQA
ncbi:LAETG motif-containing sortase-dependent surface protein [Streptomyces albofaciens]|uniref:LAETG motif-containing sortase-dependent surface protein n=1 Tax=Streptomyces albofaciens TaxID=66866 RepID=UPI00142E94D8|nr:LAETG motif-containing sortase-dependent surface protein [Streptomyces albofaciens]